MNGTLGWILVLATAAACKADAQNEQEVGPAAWVELFDGSTTNGWFKPFEWGEVWVEDQTIHLRADRKFFLLSEKTYGDFVFEVEVNVPVGGNSGIQFRSHYEKNRLWGYQAEVDTDAERRFSGGIYDEGRRGWLHDLEGQPQAQSAFKNGDWNRYRIEAAGDRLRVFVNDVLTSDIKDMADVEGHVALQHHGEAGLIYRFRNIRIRDQGRRRWEPMFNSKDFSGWHFKPGGKWEWKDGAIVGSCTSDEPRHGLLVSDAQHDDFCVRLQFRVHEGDSGFYFRTQETDDSVGVKGFQAEVDRTMETGGLYETSGRGWVVKPDEKKLQEQYHPGEWTDLWLSAQGPRIEVWLNGQSVSHLDDPAGTSKGHFALQLHGNQNVRVEFRNVEILEPVK